jgi:hypothetical protein
MTQHGREKAIRREIRNWPALEPGDDPTIIPTFALTDGTGIQREREIERALRQFSDRPSMDELLAQMLADRAKAAAASFARLKQGFASLTDDQRAEIVSDYCKACWCNDPRCQCWNDE